MSGSLAAAVGPAALRFFLPTRVVGGGGGSYLGLSFWDLLSEDDYSGKRFINYSPSYPCPLFRR